MKSFTHTHRKRRERGKEGGREGVGEREGGKEGGKEGSREGRRSKEGREGEMYLSMYLVEGLGTDNFDTVPFLIRYSF